MSSCNDPKCPLNRQGVWHDTHDKIEREEITNQCNDPRCAMNRMGMVHNVHDEFYAGMRELQETTEERHDAPRSDDHLSAKSRPPVDFTMKRERSNSQESEQLARYRQRMKAKREAAEAQERAKDETNVGDADEALNELFRNISHETQGQQSRHADQSRLRQTTVRQRTHAGTNAQTANEPTADKPSAGELILAAKNPHEAFGLSRDTTCGQIKSRYRKLARMHDSSRGRINKSERDKEQADAIMSKINKAYSNLKAMHGCR